MSFKIIFIHCKQSLRERYMLKLQNTTQLRNRFRHLPKRSVYLEFHSKGPNFSLVILKKNWLDNFLMVLVFK